MEPLFNFGIISADLKRIRRAIDRVQRYGVIAEAELPYRCAVDYHHLVARNIVTQKYASGYAPYSRRYASWKTETMGRSHNFWILYGDLLKALTAFRVDKGWMGGIPEGAMDSGGKSWFSSFRQKVGQSKPIAMYGRTMEYGENNQPERPVFTPTAEEYERDGWVDRQNRSLRKIMMAWR